MRETVFSTSLYKCWQSEPENVEHIQNLTTSLNDIFARINCNADLRLFQDRMLDIKLGNGFLK